MSKRVGLLIDTAQVSKQTYDLIQVSLRAKNYRITTLVVNDKNKCSCNLIWKVLLYVRKRGILKFASLVLFKIVCIFEGMLVKRMAKFANLYDKFQLIEDDYEVIKVKPIVSKSGLIYRYGKSDIEKIKFANLDLLIRAGSGILRGEILTVCHNGIISFHHADNSVNRGGPPGFWEVYQRNPRTGFVIQRLKDELDGGDVFYKGFISTSWLYSLNLARLLEVSNIFINYVVDDITSGEPTLNVHRKIPYAYPLYTAPNAWQTLIYATKLIVTACTKVFRKVSGRSYRWSVAYQFSDSWDDVTLWRSIRIQNPKNRFLADPFTIKRDGVHYCFVEDYNYITKRGCISTYEITKDISKELGVAIAEDFHLSYPYLFEYQNNLYMCPETHEKGEIRIYKCEDFPLNWKFFRTIMHNVSAVDTVIFPYGNKWWLFTNIDLSPAGELGPQLHIFYSQSPLSNNWIPHSQNPIIFDPFRGRNGGLIVDNEKFYRVYQRQGFDIYGQSLGVAKIASLSQEKYFEEPLFEVEARFFNAIKGIHTYNFSDGLLVFDCVELARNKTGI